MPDVQDDDLFLSSTSTSPNVPRRDARPTSGEISSRKCAAFDSPRETRNSHSARRDRRQLLKNYERFSISFLRFKASKRGTRFCELELIYLWRGNGALLEFMKYVFDTFQKSGP